MSTTIVVKQATLEDVNASASIDDASAKLKFKAYDADPIGRLLFDRLNATPLTVATASVAYAIVVWFITLVIYAVWFEGNPWTQAYREIGWSGTVFQFGVVPLVLSGYAWISRESGLLFGRLYRTGIFGADFPVIEDGVVGSTGSARSIHCSPRWFLASLLVLPIVVGVGIVGYLADPWASALTVWNLVLLPFSVVAYFLIAMMVARQSSTILALWKVFNWSDIVLRLKPLHPDKAGGLRPLNRYAMTMGYYIALGGFAIALLCVASIVTDRFVSDYLLHVMLAVYVVIACGSFFGTLGAAHRGMRDAKWRWLDQISARFDNDYDEVLRSINLADSTIEIERVRSLHQLYELTSRFPIWPFDTATIRQFVTIMSAPLAAVAVGGLVDGLSRLL